MAPPLSVCSWFVRPPSRLFIAVMRSRYGEQIRVGVTHGNICLTAIGQGTTVGASVLLRVADIAGATNSRQPEINNGLIFHYFSKRASQLTPSTRLN
jgi:hypothetical protein